MVKVKHYTTQLNYRTWIFVATGGSLALLQPAGRNSITSSRGQGAQIQVSVLPLPSRLTLNLYFLVENRTPPPRAVAGVALS
jgi:hypothetical protein